MVSQTDEAKEIIAAHEVALQVILTTICQHDKALAIKIKDGLQEAANYHSQSRRSAFSVAWSSILSKVVRLPARG